MRKHITGLALIAAVTVATAAPAGAQAAPPGCETGVGLTWANTEHTWINQTWEYRIIRSSLPTTNTRLQDRYIERILDGIRVWNTGSDRCGRAPFGGFNTRKLGETGIPGKDTHGGNHTDRESTLDFAFNVKCNGESALGCHHAEKNRGVKYRTEAGWRYRAIESDIRFDRRAYFTKRTGLANCSKMYDMWELSSHEVGHAVGLGNLDRENSRNYNQTMGVPMQWCSGFRRKLARGDYVGLLRLYRLEDP